MLGPRPDDEVVRFSSECLDELAERDVKAIGVACNTSTAVALPVLAGKLDSSHSMVTSGGSVSTGAVVSCTTITWSSLVALPQLSVAVHVRVITLSCGHVPAATASLYVMSGPPALPHGLML